MSVDELNEVTLVILFYKNVFFYSSGGVYGVPGFVGCMRLISIDGNYKLPTDWKEDVSLKRIISMQH